MARYENKLMQRSYDRKTGKDTYTAKGVKTYDLSSTRLLFSGVDTIRQIFKCNLNQDVFSRILLCYEKSYRTIEVGGHLFMLSGSGKKSGYQFVLKNIDLGFVVLLKSFYADSSERASHIKIEVSPQVIYELGLVGVSNRIRDIAKIFGDTLEAAGIAVHLFTDIKNLQLPDDFEEKLITRSKRNLKVNGISNSHFEAASASFVYGKGETYMFGAASSLQMCLYNKSLEAVKSDKLEFCEQIWRTTPSCHDLFTPEYNDGSETGESDVVHRLEFRVHHSILKEFENGHFNNTGEICCIREAKDLVNHLGGLWQYCLNNFRLQHSTTYVHPIWQKLIEDVKSFYVHDTFVYKRAQKKSGVNTRRNVACYVGNYLRIAARKGYSPSLCVNHFLSGDIRSELSDYFYTKNFGDDGDLERLLYEFCESRLQEHKLNGAQS